MNYNQTEIERLADIIQKGGTILYPTDTIWGIGCDAHNEEACQKIYDIKQRPLHKSFVLLVDTIDRLKLYADAIPQKAIRLIEYYERPLTIVYERPKGLPTIVLAENGSVAIRVTKDAFCKALIAQLGKALVSTSANLSGEPYPNGFSEIVNSIKIGVDGIANYRQDELQNIQPSTIARVVDGQDLEFIRK